MASRRSLSAWPAVSAERIIILATGKPLHIEPYLTYLREKFQQLYSLPILFSVSDYETD